MPEGSKNNGMAERRIVPRRDEDGPSSSAILRLTNKCNQACVFCCQEGREWERDPSLDEIRAKLKTAREMGVLNVTFMQGESTTRKDFVEVLKCVRDTGFRGFGFATNGTLLSRKEYLKDILDTGVSGIEFSLHSHIEETANKMSGRPFTHRRQWKALRNFASLRTNQAIIFNIVVCRHNHGHLKELVEAIEEIFPDNDFSLNIKYLLIMGMAERNMDLLVPYEQLDLTPLLAHLKVKGINVCFDNFMPCMTLGFEHRVIKTIDIVTSHKYLSKHATEEGIMDAGAFTKGFMSYVHTPECERCSLVRICPGVHAKYVQAFRGAVVRPLDIPVETVIHRVLSSTGEEARPPEVPR